MSWNTAKRSIIKQTTRSLRSEVENNKVHGAWCCSYRDWGSAVTQLHVKVRTLSHVEYCRITEDSEVIKK